MVVVLSKNKVSIICLLFLVFITLFSYNIIKDNFDVLASSGNGNQKVIIVDAGHGGEDPGAVSDYNNIKEKDINLNIATKLREMLEQEKFKVIMTRSEDKLEYKDGTSNIVEKRKEDLIRRKKMMDESGADIVVSVHLNKFPANQYYGAQTFYPPNSPGSQKLATSIQKSLRELVDPTNLREPLLKKEPLIILKDNKTTTVIVECGFLSNKDEETKLVSKEYQDKIAFAIKDGIMKYFST